MRGGAKSDFEIFVDDDKPSKSSKRLERSGKDSPKSKSPKTATSSPPKGTTRLKNGVTETVRDPKSGLKVLGNNNKENIDPHFGKPAGKKKDVAGQDTSKTDAAFHSPPNKVRGALNNKNLNVVQGKSLKQVRINDKSGTPKSKQTPKSSTILFSPLADITEAYNSKCPTPLPLSVSFSGSSKTANVDRLLEQACATAQVSETVIRILHTEASKPSIEESKTVESVKVNTLHETVSPDTELKVAEHNSICPNEAKISHLKDHIDDNRSRHDITEDAKLPAAKKDASETIANCKIEVDCSSSPATIETVRSSSGNTSVKAKQTVENPTSNSALGQMTPIHKDRFSEGKILKKKETPNKIKIGVNKLKRKAPKDVNVNDACPNKRLHDENYIACTNLLEIKLGAYRSATRTIEALPAKPFFKRFIMECAPGF